MCAKNYAICYDFKGCGARRRRFRIRELLNAAADRKNKAGRNAPLRRMPRRAVIQNGIRRFYRRNEYGNIQLPPIRINNRYYAPRIRRPRFKKIFLAARPSERYIGEANFSDLYIYKKSVSMVRKMAENLFAKSSILDLLHNDTRGVLMTFIDNEVKMKILNYIKGFYYFLKYTDTGKYVRKFQRRNYGFCDINNLDDSWLKGFEFELLDEIWTAVWRSIPGFRNTEFIINNDIGLPGTIPLRRIWRNRNGEIADECVNQIIKFLIEETYEPCFWTAISSYIF